MNSEHEELVEAIADALAKLPVRDFHGLELGEHELDILRRREAARAILALPGIESLSLRVRELEEREREREELGRRVWEYHKETTCPCVAAERYMPGCPKHGSYRT
jgi:hypothetical protein